MNRRPKHPRLEKGERRASQSSSQSPQQHGAGTSAEAGTISSLVRRTSSIVDEARRYFGVAIGVRIRRTQQSITDTMAMECVLEVLHFSARDSLEVMQLVSRRFNFFVIDIFPIYPLRKVHCLEARTNRRGVYQLQAVCLPEPQPSASTPQTVETDDSDIHLWLRNSFVNDRLELTDFFFTRDVFCDLCMMDPESVKVKQVILDYRCRPKKMQLQMDLGGPSERPVSPDQAPINGNDIRMLFNTAFSSCKVRMVIAAF
ncbi:hypothetical protein AAVH_22564 [Aphelenchoides avenae]|nr:hypothetical protein AAVH_22564 [Aphelenchus avenae]